MQSTRCKLNVKTTPAKNILKWIKTRPSEVNQNADDFGAKCTALPAPLTYDSVELLSIRIYLCITSIFMALYGDIILSLKGGRIGHYLELSSTYIDNNTDN